MGNQTINTGTDQLLCEIKDRVAIITLNRPQVRNALGDEITPALRQAIRERGKDPNVGSLLLTGAGNAFCAGGDIKGMAGENDSRFTPSLEEKVAVLKERQRTLTGALRTITKPTIAALPGPAAGAGLAIALACDIRFAGSSAFISTGYAKVGLSGDYGIAWLLTQLIGTARARELMFTADRVDAKTCHSLGLVNRVVPDNALQEEAFAFAKSLSNGPTIALKNMKENLEEALHTSFMSALDGEAERLVSCAQTRDHKEAVHAFIEKRDPQFNGT